MVIPYLCEPKNVTPMLFVQNYDKILKKNIINKSGNFFQKISCFDYRNTESMRR